MLPPIRHVAFLALLIHSQLPAQDAGASAEARREDLGFLARELPKRHKNAFHRLTSKEFAERVAAIELRIEELDDASFQGELARLVASLGDSHSAVRALALAQGDALPIRSFWWKDGLRIFEAPREHEELLGRKLKAIGSCDLEEVARRLGTVEVFDNPSMMRARVPFRIVHPRLLGFLGIIDDPAAVPLTLEGDGGEESTVVLQPEPRRRDAVMARPARLPVTAQRGSRWHHFQHLEEEGLLYVQYNRCATSREHDLERFGDRLVELCAAGKVRTLVIDLQYNGGGDSRLGDALFERLAAHPPLSERRNVFGVIGRATFSSGLLNALALKRRYGAVLVGEPTGGSPNHFGEIKSFELPRSKLQVLYSTKRFEHAAPGTTTLAPDHLVEMTFDDFRAGRDPILEKIRALAGRE